MSLNNHYGTGRKKERRAHLRAGVFFSPASGERGGDEVGCVAPAVLVGEEVILKVRRPNAVRDTGMGQI
ncbi:MAG: hypothetical protein V1736_02335 [Pseudomonadota bacterium]